MKQLSTISILFLLSLTMQASAEPLTAKQIMQQVSDRDDGTTAMSTIKLLTCNYVIKNKTTRCNNKPRIKQLESIRKDFGPAEKDHKTLSILLKPANEKGIAFLQYDYEQQGKESDQWMYLSALGKIKRIISGSSNEPKKGSFFGTEISYEDIESRHINDYTYKIMAEEVYQKRPCWVIETTPKKQRAKKSNYSKSLNWIDKERMIALKIILFDRGGNKIKRITNYKIRKQQNIWLISKMLVNNLQNKRMTLMSINSTIINLPIQDNILTTRTLTDKSFRETSLIKLRQKTQ